MIILLYPTLLHKLIHNTTKCYILLKRSSVMKPLKTKVSITLDTDIIDTVKELAEQDDKK